MRSGFIFARITSTTPAAVEPTGLRRILRRKVFTPVRHPDDPGNWDYPLQRAVFEQTQEDRARSTDWLNHATPETGWHRIVGWRPWR